MKISKEEVQHMAKLAKLKLSEEEADKMVEEFDVILEHFASMEQVDLETLGAESIKATAKTVLRKDEVVIFKDKTKLLQNVKKMRDGYIEVPKIIE